jgi:hypothetical protein
MKISLIKSSVEYAVTIYKMQIKSFKPFPEKYQDYETSPACEPLETVV